MSKKGIIGIIIVVVLVIIAAVVYFALNNNSSDNLENQNQTINNNEESTLEEGSYKLEMKKESNAYSKGFLKGSCIIVACLILGFFLAYIMIR